MSYIPVLDLGPEVEEVRADLEAAFNRVLASGQFILGPEVAAFEEEFASYLGVSYAVGVNSGTDALTIALRALGVGEGDEVITTPFSFFATAESICSVGATPVFVDIEETTFNLDVAQLSSAVTPRTKAVMPVHLYGRPCDMDAVNIVASRHGLKVVEDTAQAFGARHGDRHVGSVGDAGAFSFFPSKNLGGYGDGGLIATDHEEWASAARMLRAHGSKAKYHNVMVGYNSRLDSLQAAFLRVKLPHVDRWNKQRRAVALRYNEMLAGIDGLTVPEIVDGHVFHQYTVRITTGARDAVQAALKEDGVATMIYYPTPQDRLPVFADKYRRYPNSEKAAGQVLSLPMGPFLGVATQERVVESLIRAVQERAH